MRLRETQQEVKARVSCDMKYEAGLSHHPERRRAGVEWGRKYNDKLVPEKDRSSV